MRTYWIAFCNDDVPLFDVERDTRSEAINDLKEAFSFDHRVAGDAAYDNDYYIQKFCETDDTLYVMDKQYFKMTIGKRSGVKALRIKDV